MLKMLSLKNYLIERNLKQKGYDEKYEEEC